MVIDPVGGPEKIFAQYKANQKKATENPPEVRASDQVDISPEARSKLVIGEAIKRAADSQGEVRADVVEAARQKMSEGGYETPEAIRAVAVELSKLISGG